MKKTLLEIVQDILFDMNSDQVNSIGDTIEATQVANICRSTYELMIVGQDWPHTMRLFRVASSADNTKPSHMFIEDQVANIEWVKYDCRESADAPKSYKTIEWKEPQDFLTFVMSRDPSRDNVETVIDYHGTPLFIINDHAPEYYTSFDDTHLVFDSYNASVDTTLQHSKTQAYGKIIPEWDTRDDFVPDLPAKHFPAYIAECKSTAFLRIKEVADAKSEQHARATRSFLHREKRRGTNGIRYPNYGRK
jgi:hypothetical protein